MMTNNNAQILTVDQMARFAPAIYAADKAPNTSERYGFVSTADVLATLALDGWQPTTVAMKRGKTEEARRFGSHTIRLRRDTAPITKKGDSRVEIVLRNAHDTTSGVRFDAGVFRMVCANGLIVADSNFGGFSIRHNLYAADKVREGIAGMMRELPRLNATLNAWQEIQLTQDERRLLAEGASRLRWDAESTPVAPETLLVPLGTSDNDFTRTYRSTASRAVSS